MTFTNKFQEMGNLPQNKLEPRDGGSVKEVKRQILKYTEEGGKWFLFPFSHAIKKTKSCLNTQNKIKSNCVYEKQF